MIKNQTILVVDDEPSIRRLVRAYLEEAGYRVLVADDGAGAITLYEEHRTTIRLVLTDVMMPKMNGLQLADCVLRYEPEARVLFMSGNSPSASRGFGCLQKPFKAAELIDKIDEVLKGRQPPQMEQAAPAG